MQSSSNVVRIEERPVPHRKSQSATSNDSVISSSRELSNNRIKRGECPDCGLKTHRVGMFQKPKPLTVHGYVLNGKCLLCNTTNTDPPNPPNIQLDEGHVRDLKQKQQQQQQSMVPVSGVSNSDGHHIQKITGDGDNSLVSALTFEHSIHINNGHSYGFDHGDNNSDIKKDNKNRTSHHHPHGNVLPGVVWKEDDYEEETDDLEPTTPLQPLTIEEAMERGQTFAEEEELSVRYTEDDIHSNNVDQDGSLQGHYLKKNSLNTTSHNISVLVSGAEFSKLKANTKKAMSGFVPKFSIPGRKGKERNEITNSVTRSGARQEIDNANPDSHSRQKLVNSQLLSSPEVVEHSTAVPGPKSLEFTVRRQTRPSPNAAFFERARGFQSRKDGTRARSQSPTDNRVDPVKPTLRSRSEGYEGLRRKFQTFLNEPENERVEMGRVVSERGEMLLQNKGINVENSGDGARNGTFSQKKWYEGALNGLTNKANTNLCRDMTDFGISSGSSLNGSNQNSAHLQNQTCELRPSNPRSVDSGNISTPDLSRQSTAPTSKVPLKKSVSFHRSDNDSACSDALTTTSKSQSSARLVPILRNPSIGSASASHSTSSSKNQSRHYHHSSDPTVQKQQHHPSSQKPSNKLLATGFTSLPNLPKSYYGSDDDSEDNISIISENMKKMRDEDDDFIEKKMKEIMVDNENEDNEEEDCLLAPQTGKIKDQGQAIKTRLTQLGSSTSQDLDYAFVAHQLGKVEGEQHGRNQWEPKPPIHLARQPRDPASNSSFGRFIVPSPPFRPGDPNRASLVDDDDDDEEFFANQTRLGIGKTGNSIRSSGPHGFRPPSQQFFQPMPPPNRPDSPDDDEDRLRRSHSGSSRGCAESGRDGSFRLLDADPSFDPDNGNLGVREILAPPPPFDQAVMLNRRNRSREGSYFDDEPNHSRMQSNLAQSEDHRIDHHEHPFVLNQSGVKINEQNQLSSIQRAVQSENVFNERNVGNTFSNQVMTPKSSTQRFEQSGNRLSHNLDANLFVKPIPNTNVLDQGRDEPRDEPGHSASEKKTTPKNQNCLFQGNDSSNLFVRSNYNEKDFDQAREESNSFVKPQTAVPSNNPRFQGNDFHGFVRPTPNKNIFDQSREVYFAKPKTSTPGADPSFQENDRSGLVKPTPNKNNFDEAREKTNHFAQVQTTLPQRVHSPNRQNDRHLFVRQTPDQGTEDSNHFAQPKNKFPEIDPSSDHPPHFEDNDHQGFVRPNPSKNVFGRSISKEKDRPGNLRSETSITTNRSTTFRPNEKSSDNKANLSVRSSQPSLVSTLTKDKGLGTKSSKDDPSSVIEREIRQEVMQCTSVVHIPKLFTILSYEHVCRSSDIYLRLFTFLSALVVSKEGKRIFFEVNGQEILVEELWKHMEKPRVQLAICITLWSLSSDSGPDDVVKLSQCGAAEAILCGMQSHLEHSNLMVSVCGVLGSFAIHESKMNLMSMGVIISIVNMMKRNSEEKNVLVSGVRTLWVLCKGDATGERIIEAEKEGCAQILVSVLRLGKGGELWEWGCRLLWCLSSNYNVAVKMVNEHPTLVDLVFKGMTQESYLDMEAACGFLVNLSSITEQDVFNLGGIDSSTLANIIIDLMHKNDINEGLKLQGCIMLANFSAKKKEFCRAVVENGGIKVAFDLARSSERNEDLEELACSLLFSSLIDCSDRKNIFFENMHGIILEMFRRHQLSSKTRILELILGVLSYLAMDSDNAVFSNEPIQMVVAIFDHYKDEVCMLTMACSYIQNISHRPEPVESSILQSCMKALICCMSSHPKISSIQEASCSSLWNFSKDSPERSSSIVESGGIQAVIAAMRSHDQSEKIQELACGTLWCLLSNDFPKSSDQSSRNIIGLNGMDVIICAIFMCPRCIEVQENACGVLSALSVDGSIALKLTLNGAIDALIESMRNNMSSTFLLEYGCLTFRNIAVAHTPEPETCVSMTHCILRAMREHPDHQNVQHEACSALWSLSTSKIAVKIKSEILSGGGMDLIMSILDHGDWENDVHKDAREALESLII